MSRFIAWIAVSLILIGSVWSQEESHGEQLEEARFGFGFLDPLRKSFCKNSCTSPDKMPYVVNVVCAVKCPELYLPSSTSGPSSSSNPPTTSSNPPSTSSNPSMTSSTTSTATSSTTTSTTSTTTPAAMT